MVRRHWIDETSQSAEYTKIRVECAVWCAERDVVPWDIGEEVSEEEYVAATYHASILPCPVPVKGDGMGMMEWGWDCLVPDVPDVPDVSDVSDN